MSVLTTETLLRWRWAAALLPIAGAAFYLVAVVLSFRHLPNQIPVHFGLDGSPNGWMGRLAWCFISPVLIVNVVAMVMFARPNATWIFSISALMYWGACGLVCGAFLEILRSAQTCTQFRVVSLVTWIPPMVIGECLIIAAIKKWCLT